MLLNSSQAGTATSAASSAVRTRGRRTATRRPPNVTDPSSTRTHRGPVPVVLALRADQCGHVGLHHRVHHLHAGADREGQQTLLRRLGDSPNDTNTCSGTTGARVASNALLLVDVAHGGPLLRRCDLAVARHLPLGRLWAGTATLKF